MKREEADDELDEDPAEVEAAWAAEIKRRIDEYDAGLVESIPAEDVFAKARALVRKIEQERAQWEAAIQARVEGIRNGTGHCPELEELLAEQDRRRIDSLASELYEEDDEDGDPAEVEAAWAEEIQRRVEEIRAGTAKTYAAEDVFAALRLRFG